ncbi:MAG: hypothetical protein WDZ61_00350 [Parcubacteria group bacterium]
MNKSEAVARKTHMSSERPKRVSLLDQKRDILSVKNKDDAFEYRWINDVENRIERMRIAGYEVVTDDMLEIGERTVEGQASTVGTPVSKLVGNGITAYLMRILKEYYIEDQERKQEELDQKERAMLAEAHRERYGKLEVKHHK